MAQGIQRRQRKSAAEHQRVLRRPRTAGRRRAGRRRPASPRWAYCGARPPPGPYPRPATSPTSSPPALGHSGLGPSPPDKPQRAPQPPDCTDRKVIHSRLCTAVDAALGTGGATVPLCTRGRSMTSCSTSCAAGASPRPQRCRRPPLPAGDGPAPSRARRRASSRPSRLGHRRWSPPPSPVKPQRGRKPTRPRKPRGWHSGDLGAARGLAPATPRAPRRMNSLILA